MLSCALCSEWTVGRLCTDCVVLRHAMTLYGKDSVIKRVNQIFVRHEKGLCKQTGAILHQEATVMIEKTKAHQSED